MSKIKEKLKKALKKHLKISYTLIVNKINTNPLIFTHEYIDEKCDDNEFALVIYAASRAKALHVGMSSQIPVKPGDKLACNALLEIVHGQINTAPYKDGVNHTLDSFMERIDSKDLNLGEEDLYDVSVQEDDLTDNLEALNKTVIFE